MILVVTGAGASWASLAESDVDQGMWLRLSKYRPPLAQDLFSPQENYAKLLPSELRGLAQYLRSAMRQGANLEQQLELLGMRDDVPSKRELFALRFYIRDVIRECDAHWEQVGLAGNNYDSLVRRLTRWSHVMDETVLYATFNYDNLLERSIATAGRYDIESMDAYIANPFFRLFKLHGSIDWFRSFGIRRNVVDEAQWVIDEGWSVPFPELIEREGPTTQSREGPVQPDVYEVRIPAIAIPIQNKLEFECPENHLSSLKQSLQLVDRILVIGWRGQEQHFLSLLDQYLPKIQIPTLIANGTPDASIGCRNAMSQTLEVQSRRLDTRSPATRTFGFSELSSSIELEWLLQ